MYLNQLTPYKKNYMEYIPEHLINDPLNPQIFYGMAPFFHGKMSEREYIGFVDSLANFHQILRGDIDDKEAKAVWFSTDEVVDVRLLFRNTERNEKKSTLGSKMRLYSMGTPQKSDVPEVQSIDSGFITYNSYPMPSTHFQSAMAKTMFYNSLYAIGSRASIRKINEENKTGSIPPVFKWLSALQPRRTDGVDWSQYTHILHPAALAAGIDNPEKFFEPLGGNKVLDDILHVFLSAQSMDDWEEKMLNIDGLELYDEDIDAIVESSNNDEANLDNSKDFSEGKAEGINVVSFMENIYDIFQ